MSGRVVVTGTAREPILTCHFNPWERHPLRPSFTLLDFIKSLPDRRFEKKTKTWTVTGTGVDPDGKFERAGMDIDWSEADEEAFADISGLNDLVDPLVRLTADRGHILVRPRLLGSLRVAEALGAGAHWEKKRRRYRMSVAALHSPTHMRGVLDIPDEAYSAGLKARDTQTTPPELDGPASALGHAARISEVPAAHRAITESLGTDIPTWFGLDLFPFQRAGALAVAAGHTMLSDEPGLGKCVVPDTTVIANGTTARLGDLWAERGHRSYADPDGDSGELIDLAPGELRVPSLNAETASAVTAEASHLYRQRYRGPVHTVAIDNGRSITCTPRHRLWTQNGWERADSIEPGDCIGSSMLHDSETSADAPKEVRVVSDDVRWSEVHSNKTSSYDGYVYDLSIPGTRSYTAEGMWTHNTRQALAAAAIRAPERTVIVVPPVALTNWAANVDESLLAHAAAYRHDGGHIEDLRGGGEFGDDTGFKAAKTPPQQLAAYAKTRGIAVWVSGKKAPALPEAGVAIVGDTMLAARPALAEELAQWGPELLIVDEIHREKSLDADRTLAVQKLALATSGPRIGITGTPLLGSPVDLVSPLSITNHLDGVFGSDSDFLTDYCRLNTFGKWEPQKRRLPQLGSAMADYVWVRRTKAQVLPDLPKKMRVTHWVDVNLADYRRSHGEVVTEFADRAEEFFHERGHWPSTKKEYEAIFGDPFTAMSPLRKAAGLAKVDAVAEHVLTHLDAQAQDLRETGLHNRPAIVWVHHQEVAEKLAEALRAGGYEDSTRVIVGGITKSAKDRIVEEFQAGHVAVLIASIQAANVAITLTRSCDVYFAERDWRAAQISQAEDRALRIGQARTVTSTTLLAAGTFDERIEGVLSSAGGMLEPVLTGGDNHVSSVDESRTRTASEILAEMVEKGVQGRKRKLSRLAREGATA